MKVTTIKSITNTERHVRGEGFDSIRAVLAKDGLGFSVHKTIIPAGPPRHWHYKNHLEVCYCIQGAGILTNLTTGAVYNILPDTVYMLDSHDDHTFQALNEVVLISIFNPPVTGHELHDEDGSYSIED